MLATPLRQWIEENHNTVLEAARALGVSHATLHNHMNSAYVIDGVLYRPVKAGADAQ